MPAVRSLNAASSAAISLAGTKRAPGTSGSKSCRYLGWPVIESAPMLRPWKEFSSAMISYFSGMMARPCECTILSAPSIASVPVLAKKQRCSPLISASRLASGP